ncbi:MAG TPA: sugar phosphate nucleotidyltransferase [Gemmatimonadales bacterium]|nr:sugar phosphate nucleotidyltransferase [Gemmatimonadales bacterium]
MNWAVIVAGGSGTRFWPLSTPARPKQLLPLAGPEPLAVDALRRLEGLIPVERTLLVTGAALARPLGQGLGLPVGNILVEPRAASTAPALLWATAEIARRDPDAVVLSLHADWAIPDAAKFRKDAAHALAAAAAHDVLVTVGIVPSRPDTGYGYIVPGAPIERGVRKVSRFTEKPDAAGAADLIASGALWNSGLFAWSARRLRAEVEQHTAELTPGLEALDRGDVAGFFAQLTPVSIDVGVLERSERVAVVSGHFAWDDVGTWDALTRTLPRDAAGNVTHGTVHLKDAAGNVVWTDGAPIVVRGVQDLVVVHANGRILVMPRALAADLKALVDPLPPTIRELK